jgi:hypothetical protein
MHRFVKILIHIVVFAIGIPVVAFSDFWDWGLLRGMVLPIVATGFLAYLVLFLLLRGYTVFTSAYTEREA